MMKNEERDVAAAIVENIELLEGAIKLANTKMDDELNLAIEQVFEQKKQEFMWEGHSEEWTEKPVWIASSAWRAADEEVDGEYDLFFELNVFGDVETFVARWLGELESGVRLETDSNTLKKKSLKAVYSHSEILLKKLTKAGLIFNPTKGCLYVDVVMPRADLVEAFRSGDFDHVKEPIESALNLVKSCEDLLTKLALAIREESVV